MRKVGKEGGMGEKDCERRKRRRKVGKQGGTVGKGWERGNDEIQRWEMRRDGTEKRRKKEVGVEKKGWERRRDGRERLEDNKGQ